MLRRDAYLLAQSIIEYVEAYDIPDTEDEMDMFVDHIINTTEEL